MLRINAFVMRNETLIIYNNHGNFKKVDAAHTEHRPNILYSSRKLNIPS